MEDRSEKDQPDVDEVLDELTDLRDSVEDDRQREQVDKTISLVTQLPRRERIRRRIGKYTTRDAAETFVGGIIFSLPLLVEDGVFDIAEHFTTTQVLNVPVFLIANVLFIVLVTVGLVYWADFRRVDVSKPILGFIPRRLFGILCISFMVATGMTLLWGRAFDGDPTNIEVIGRITIIWAAAAFGGAIGDILPGESQGKDLAPENF
ncbi:DUF2391 domain-containing protein [Salinarchaeum sp. IM2453]|uniref:DUF2391 domain-containing protein n=1 Tax=Salinarchaeum sp. IM2453 TaxID=2862870 RepID=UPI001C83EF21|nr:DUF2391 domain-containing protein [Salinarchaeum sp. IM2453]QZA89637.1 DUF2391 domain-containing protein [Salinarchaeum sp. IM2453]